MKTRTVAAMVAGADLVGEAVTFLGGFANSIGWDVAKFPCECAWAVLAFPLGWLGFIAGSLSAASRGMWGMRYACLWAGVAMNAILWGWVVYKLIRSVQGQPGYSGFDASLVRPRITQVRQNHAILAHSRSKPLQARRELLAAAGRALTKLAYFSRTAAEREKTEHQEAPTNEP
jgi:hypothetical protein